MHLCVPRSLPHCLSPYLTLYLTVPLFTPLSITHCLSLCLSLYLTLHLCASLYTSVCLSLCLSTPRASLTEVWSFRLELDKQSSFGKPTTIGPRGNYLHIPHAAISNLRKHEHVSVRMILQRRHPSKANLEGKTVSDVTSVSMLSSSAAEITVSGLEEPIVLELPLTKQVSEEAHLQVNQPT